MNSPYRWIVLSVFVLAAAMSQLLWLNFAPLISYLQARYSVTETTASLLILVFPLIYVLLSVHAGRMTDRRGYKFTVGAGTVIMAVFACMRIYDASFWALLVAQTGIAIAQPYVLNGISKLVLDWFSKEQGAIATGIGTMGMFLGMTAGMAATPSLVESIGFRGTMAVCAVAAIAVMVLFLALCRANPSGDSQTQGEEQAVGAVFRALLGKRDLLLLFIVSFLGLGFFNGLTTWLEPILAPNGIDAVKAGVIGGVLIVGGIVGAIVLPAISDKMRKRKPFLFVSLAAALATTYPLCNGSHFSALVVLSAVQGFFFLPAFAILLEMCSELAGEAMAGSATGILMLFGNAGGVIVILGMEWVKGGGVSFQPSVILLLVLLVAALGVSTAIGETFHLRGRA